MGYLGNVPATSFETVRKQVSTTNSGTTINLDFPVTNVQDLLVTVDAIVQSYDNYSLSAGGTVLNLGGTLNNNRVEILYVGRTFGSVNAPDNSVTTAQLQDNIISTAKLQNNSVTSSKLNGLGNYVIEKIDEYHYGTEVTTTSATNYIDIAGGNTISFTPTSTNDIFVFSGMNLVYVQNSAAGIGIGIARALSSSITSGDTHLTRTGRHAIYVNAASNYHIASIEATDTGLTAGITHYYEMFGMVHGSSGERKWNVNVSNAINQAKHKLIGVHYKYIG